MSAKERDRGPKTKACFRCGKPTEVAYRVRHDDSGRWDFVCPACLDAVKAGNPRYVYGGTWKGSRH